MKINIENCTHIFSYKENEDTTTFECIMCGRTDIVSNNLAQQFKQNNFIAIPKASEA